MNRLFALSNAEVANFDGAVQAMSREVPFSKRKDAGRRNYVSCACSGSCWGSCAGSCNTSGFKGANTNKLILN